MNLTALWDVSNQFNHKNGSILAGGKIYVFYEGRSQLATTFVDGAGQVVNPNPILLDNNGRATCFADDAYSYTCVVCDFYGKEQFSFNPVGLGGQSSTAITKYNITSDSLNVTSAYDASTNTKTFDIEIQNTNPQHWYGMYGATIQHDGSTRGITLPLPTNISYEGNFIDRIEDGKYIYLKEGIYLVDCVIRFEQDPAHLENKIEEVLVYTGNGNANEDQNFILDETGRYSYTADYRKCIKQSFVRIVKEGDRYSSNLLYFAPGFPVPCRDMYIQNLSIVKLENYVGSGGSSSGEVYKAGEHIVIDPYNVISTSGLVDVHEMSGYMRKDEYPTMDLVAGQGINIDVQNNSAFISASGFVTPTQLETALNSYVTEQTFNTNIQNINSALSGKQDNLSFMYNSSGDIIGINNSAIAGGAGGGGMTYQAGEGIGIEGNVISVSGSYLQTSAYTAPVQSDWNQTNSSSLDYILNKPNTEEVQFEELDLTGLASQQYVDQQILSATSGLQPAGDYVKQDDLSAYVTNNTFNQTINNIEANVSGKLDTSAYTAPVNADWNSSTGLSEILNKPSTEEVQFEELDLSTYAQKSDLGNYQPTSGMSNYAEKSDLAGKLDTSAYVAPVNSDWNATSGLAEILNKPNTEEVQFEELDLSDFVHQDSLSAYITSGDFTLNQNNEITEIKGFDIAGNSQDTDIFWAVYNTTTYQDTLAAYNAGKKIFVYYNGKIFPMVQKGGNPDRFTFTGIIDPWSPGGPKLQYITLSTRDGWYVNSSGYEMQANWNQTSTYYPDYIKNKPDLSTYATKTYVDNGLGNKLDASAYVAPHEYTAGQNIAIQNDEISVSGTSTLVAGQNVTITESGESYIISSTGGGGSTYTAGTGIAIQNDVISVSGSYLETSAYTAPVNADWNSSTGLSEILNKPSTEEVAFEELDLSDFVQQNDLSGYASKSDLGNYQPTSGMSAYQTVAGMSSYQTVAGMSSYQTVAGMSSYQTVSGMSSYATDNEVAAAVSGKQNKITAFNDSVLVNALPASPVATTLYLIPEA